jgi:uncharacterized protein YjgD (DUF1641 family)
MAEQKAGPPALDEAQRAQVDAALAALVDNGDLDRIVHLARLIGSAQDSINDEIVGRLAGIVGDGIDLVDRANRSGVAKAMPAIAALVENGDLDRIVALARLIGSAQDSMNDEMVGRLAGIASDGMDLVDQATRAGVVKAIPAIGRLVDNGDLDRVVDLVRLIGAAQDSMTDDMIVRLAGVASHGLSIVETMTRTGLGDQLVKLAAHVERSGLAPDFLNAVDFAAKEVAAAPPPKGGIGGLMGLLHIMKQPETQRAIHFAVAMLCSLCKARVEPHVKNSA